MATEKSSLKTRAIYLARSDTGKAAGMASAQIGANVVALLFVVVFARILGDDGYGSLGSLLSAFLILYVPGQALQVAVAREVSARVARNDPDPGAGVRRWIDRLLVLTGVVVVVSILLRHQFASVIAVEKYPWAAAAAPVGACIWMIVAVERGAMQAFQRYAAVGWSLVGEQGARIVTAAILVAAGLDVTGAFLGSMLSYVAAAAALSLPLHHELTHAHGGVLHGEHRERRLRDLFHRSWAPLLALAFISILQNVDVIIVNHRFSNETASDWTAAAVAGKGILWVAIGLGFWLVPEAAKRVHSGNDASSALLKTIIGVVLIAVPMLLVYGLFGHKLLDIVFKLSGASGALPWLGLGFTFLAAAYLSIQYLLALHHWTFLWPLGAAAILQPILLAVIDGGTTKLAMAICGVEAALAVVVVTQALRTRDIAPGELLDDIELSATGPQAEPEHTFA
jgi:O-antigen/teichoic acid export membrane protein